MEARVKWVEDLTFMAESPSGHAILLSAGTENGGKDNCLRPMELLLLGVGGCASIDVVSILKKARQAISDCEVSVTAERFDGIPGYFTKINCHFTVTGTLLREKQVQRAVDLSFEKYCSVSFTLREKVEITWSFEINEA
ncbi:MAG: OsmC family protein [Gammaproteobacteria bacterium]|nr:OsmC family protein [Gammaproteobacteria bacterium]